MSSDVTDRVPVAIITLGCARNEVDSEELAARLRDGGFELVEDAEAADAVLVNTCGFIDAAKKDSIDTILAAADLGESGTSPVVVAVGCMAERYGEQLAAELPEAAAVLGFDEYPNMAAKLRSIMAGEQHVSHTPKDRRLLLPITPVERRELAADVPGHSFARVRLETGPVANVKLASGCDRRCTFCAIPSFRGAYVSRHPEDVITELSALAAEGVREAVLVSENSTSYGKDLGDLRMLESMLPEFASHIDRVRIAYLQPAEMRPGLVQVIADTPGVAHYFDLSFQHASGAVLKKMRRFGDAEAFLGLIKQIRDYQPESGIRSNFIVGFPGETEEDVELLAEFLSAAALDAIGVFAYSDEDGTEAAGFDEKLPDAVIDERFARITDLAEQLVLERATDRIGTVVQVLVESTEEGDDGPLAVGRAAHQGPDDAATIVRATRELSVGEFVLTRIVDTEGADLIGVAL